MAQILKPYHELTEKHSTSNKSLHLCGLSFSHSSSPSTHTQTHTNTQNPIYIVLQPSPCSGRHACRSHCKSTSMWHIQDSTTRNNALLKQWTGIIISFSLFINWINCVWDRVLSAFTIGKVTRKICETTLCWYWWNGGKRRNRYCSFYFISYWSVWMCNRLHYESKC